MMNRKLVLSTNNPHKVDEIKKILKDFPIDVLSKKEVLNEDIQVVEDGDTLEENSLKKARALADRIDYMVMADDSGLFVDALDGAPGVHSSRYAGEEGNDKRNIEKLLEELKDIPLEDRTAKFMTVITLITENKEIYTIKGECSGYIIDEKRGNNGFGYDPLFVPLEYDKTFAELGEEVKNRISHRAKALEGMKDLMRKLFKGEADEDSRS